MKKSKITQRQSRLLEPAAQVNEIYPSKKSCTRFAVCCQFTEVELTDLNEHLTSIVTPYQTNHRMRCNRHTHHITLCVRWWFLTFSLGVFFLHSFCFAWRWCFVQIKASRRRTVFDSVFLGDTNETRKTNTNINLRMIYCVFNAVFEPFILYPVYWTLNNWQRLLRTPHNTPLSVYFSHPHSFHKTAQLPQKRRAKRTEIIFPHSTFFFLFKIRSTLLWHLIIYGCLIFHIVLAMMRETEIQPIDSISLYSIDN